MKENGKKRFIQETMLGEECLKASQHHTVLEYQKTRGDTGKYTRNKFQEWHPNVIEGNAQEHIQFISTIINRHRFSILDILQCHIHIIISQYNTTKVGIKTLGYHTDEYTDEEYAERSQK